MEKKLSTRRMVTAALLAALTAVASALRVTLPIQIAGKTSFHLGNIVCALSGLMLGPWLGGLAAGLGSAIYDITGSYIDECWITFLTKGALGLVAGLAAGRSRWSYGRATLASAAGALTYATLYLIKSYFYNGLLVSALTPDAAALTVLAKLPATIFNAAVAVIFTPPLAVAIRSALERSREA